MWRGEGGGVGKGRGEWEGLEKYVMENDNLGDFI
jgi:hypothetical protein